MFEEVTPNPYEGRPMSKSRDLSVLPNQSLSFKNRLINGAMQIWQRGTSSTTSGVYGTADRWLQIGTSATWSQSTDVPTGFRHSMSVSGSNFVQIVQRIESLNCTDLVGETVTFSFWLKQTAGTGGIVAFLQYANTTDNFSAVTNVPNSIYSSTTSGSWVLYVFTVHNLPAQVANGLQFIVYANTSGAATFLLTGAQVEKGSTATSFDYRPYGTELQLCQRYYWKPSQDPIGLAATGFGAGGRLNNPVPMRTAATISGATFSVNTGSAGTVTSIYQTVNGQIVYNSANNWTTNASISVNGDVSAEL